MNNKYVNILSFIFAVVFFIFWFNTGGHQFFEFLKKPTSEWQFFDYAILFAISTSIVAWLTQRKRNKIKDKVNTIYEEIKSEETIKTSGELDIPQELIDQVEKTRNTYVWLFLITTLILILLYVELTIITTPNSDIKIEEKSVWSIDLIFNLIPWFMFSALLASGLQWSYSKKYHSVYVDSVLNNLNLQDVKVSIINQNPKYAIKKYLPGMPYGQINGSETLVIVTDQYSVHAASITIDRHDNSGSGA